MTTKAFVRFVMVATSTPPFASLYRAMYQALAQIAVWRLKRFKGVQAVYLRRGMAGSEGIPGISDIDLAAIGDWDTAAQNRVTESYQRLARLCPLYDPTIGVYTPETVAKFFQTDPFLRHRLDEGRRTWKRMFGDDCLSHLGPVGANEAAVGYEAETKLWWSYFACWAFPADNQPPDRVFLNSLCYKVVTETFRMDCGLRGEVVPESRRAALEDAVKGLPSAFLERLRQSASKRHLRYQGTLVDDANAFLLPFLEDLYRRLESHPAWQVVPGVSMRLDSPAEEQLHSAETLDHCRKCAERAGWHKVQFVSGSAFAMDELVVLCEPPAGDLPGPAALRAIVRSFAEAKPHPRSRLNVHVLLPAAAYQLYASDSFRGWQAVLSPGSQPDVFAILQRPESRWTQPAADFITQERLLVVEALDDRRIYKANNLDFLRTFWKLLELIVIEQGARKRDVVLPQTPAAIVRALDKLNLPRVPFLNHFDQAYRDELGGRQADIGKSIPAAIQYLKQINHEL